MTDNSESTDDASYDALRMILFVMEYHAAAIAVDGVPTLKRDVDDCCRPAMFLVCQSIELAIKAYLKRHGASDVELVKDYGHRLVRLLKGAERTGLDFRPLEDVDRRVLADAENLYAKKRLQYWDPADEIWPDFSELAKISSVLLYRALEEEPLRFVLLALDHAKPIVDVLVSLQTVSPEVAFELPTLLSPDELIDL